MWEICAVITIVFLTLAFDFANGLNDASNAICTVVATKVLTPKRALVLASLGNFAGPFLLGTAVATTVGKGIVSPDVVDFYVIVAALIGANFWAYFTTYQGLPISITHSLIGGLIGSALMKGGLAAVVVSKVETIILFIGLAPLLGFLGALIFTIAIFWAFRNSRPAKVNKYFKRLQVISASLYSIGHGGIDAQTGMGVISLMLFTYGYLGQSFHVPWWVVVACAASISLGTLGGGWRVIKTMGMKITKLRPVDGFCAETSGGLTIVYCSLLGIPVSTTHVISGSIMGVGSTRRLSAVRWGVAWNIFWTWILTIPASALVSAGVYALFQLL